MLYFAPTAALLAAIDTLQWLMTVFALAGPILLSGIYEAVLDSRILAYVETKIGENRLSTAQRAHLLYIVLVGNLDMLGQPDGEPAGSTTWNNIDGADGLLRDLRAFTLDSPGEVAGIKRAKTELRTMLAAQYSFGVTVGAGKFFFCGSFIYALLDNYANLGDKNVSHALGRS